MFNYTSIPALTSFIAQEARAREIRNETGVAGLVAKGSLGVPFHSFCIHITHFVATFNNYDDLPQNIGDGDYEMEDVMEEGPLVDNSV